VVLDQARLRTAAQKSPADRFPAESVDLGNEPPLSVDGGDGHPIDRRRISVQWLSGAILTGLCGAALMGGAVFASLDGETTFAKAPERVGTALHGALVALGDRLGGTHKADRLPSVNESDARRVVLHVPTITRSRNREVVRVRPYARVFGDLMLNASPELTAKVPKFNLQKLLASAVTGNDDQEAAPQADAEVSFSTCDFVEPAPRPKVAPALCNLNALLPKVKASTLLPLDEVMARVSDVAREAGIGASKLSNGVRAARLRMSYASEPEPDPYIGFAARIVPENVTLLPKTTTKPDVGDGTERIIVATKGQSVASILHGLNVPPVLIKQIVAVLGPGANELKDGQKVHVLLAPPLAGRVLPLRVMVAGDDSINAAAALSDMNTYVPVDISNIDSDIAESSESRGASEAGPHDVTLYQSLYETALRNNVPDSVITEILSIYAYDVDFQRKVEPGDSFDVLYSEDANSDGSYEVRYVSLDLGGEIKKFYHFRAPDDGMYDYYDDTGKSAKKFLVRKPVAIGAESSPFGWRIHPLLHIKEFHSGVDWAAPIGTPIFAAGNGSIEFIGRRGGYGKYVRIHHADGYETAYGHMTAFARGLRVGSHVQQGQIIGFVGSTGMSTGPHVHFEIWVNGRVVDPMRIKLPRGRVLAGDTLAEFEKNRLEIDALLANPSSSHLAEAQ
jgi:murein DD-endopeptidase MepM/ murein hydrolase activator NlpD